MTYIGVDPGKKGAFAVINNNGVQVHQFEEGFFAGCMYAASQNEPKPIACVEHVNAMPGQGVVSMFNFGQNFGFIQGVLTALGIPFELVRPQKWKKEFSITSDKNTSIEVCKRLFPGVRLLPTERSKKENDNLAEALLLAEWARRKMGR